MDLVSLESAESFEYMRMVIRFVVVMGIHSHRGMWTWGIIVQVPNPSLGDQERASIARDGSPSSCVTKEKQVYRHVYLCMHGSYPGKSE